MSLFSRLHSKNDLKKSFEEILDQALKLPSMSDVYYTITNNPNETKALIITENKKGNFYDRSTEWFKEITIRNKRIYCLDSNFSAYHLKNQVPY